MPTCQCANAAPGAAPFFGGLSRPADESEVVACYQYNEQQDREADPQGECPERSLGARFVGKQEEQGRTEAADYGQEKRNNDESHGKPFF